MRDSTFALAALTLAGVAAVAGAKEPERGAKPEGLAATADQRNAPIQVEVVENVPRRRSRDDTVLATEVAEERDGEFTGGIPYSALPREQQPIEGGDERRRAGREGA